MLLEPRSLSSGLRREFVLWTVPVDTRGEIKKEVIGRWEIRALITVGWEAFPKAPDGTWVPSLMAASRTSVLLLFLLTEETGGLGGVGWEWAQLSWCYEPWVLCERVNLVTNCFSLLFPVIVIPMSLHDGRCFCRLCFLRGSQVPEKHLCIVPVESGLILCWVESFCLNLEIPMSHVIQLFSKNRRFCSAQCHLGAFACHF